ncbi:MAG: sulfotransferase [Cyanobacteria bacterium J06648_1]
MITYKQLLFKKSLLKDYIRREIPIPFKTDLNHPIFILGSSRSGTSILARVIGESNDVCSFTENNIVRRHMWRMVENQKILETEIPELRKTIARLSGVSQCKRVLEKTPGLSLLAKPLANYFNDAQFIHIIRDGRDVAFSMLKHDWIARELQDSKVFWFDLLPKTYQQDWKDLDLWKKAILRWAVYVSTAREISNSDSYLEINYEELCREPNYIIDNILQFLNITISPNMKNQVDNIKYHQVKTWQEREIKPEWTNFYYEVIEYFDLANDKTYKISDI